MPGVTLARRTRTTNYLIGVFELPTNGDLILLIEELALFTMSERGDW